MVSSPRRRGGRSSSLRWKGSQRNSARPSERPDVAELRFFARLQNLFSLPPRTIPERVSRLCAADAAYRGREVVAAAALSVKGVLAKASRYRGRFTFPYVSGLFYLHEGPFVVAAVERLRSRPQLVCFDAHGGAHPRSAGLATVAGMVLGIPSIGVAKSLLVGTVGEADQYGLRSIVYGGGVVGFVTGEGKRRRYWSPGYTVTLGELKRIILLHGEACLESLAEAHRVAVGEFVAQEPS